MAKKANKYSLDEEQDSALDHIHDIQITIEVMLVLVALGAFTFNLGSIWPDYKVIDLLALAISCFVLLICCALLTSWGSELSKLGEPLESSVTDLNLKRWLAVTWWWLPVFILVVVALNDAAGSISDVAKSVTAGAVILCFFMNVIYDLVITQSLWKRFNRRERPLIRPITYSALALIMVLVAIFGSYTTTAALKYASITTSDSNLELGQSEVRQPGKNGQTQTVHNLILGFTTATTQTDPVNQITAKGTRRYQYMYCSNGSYRYYTAENFKDPNVGFTHKSLDACAISGQGTETTVADTPPARTQTTYVPSYTPPIYTPPTTTHCYTWSSSSIDCYSY